jgi:50S ribosomal protein L16 3-hydroxylase
MPSFALHKVNLGMSTQRFMREYWQKKPLLVRAAFTDFRDPLDADELAGLACEDEVESRLVEKRRTRGWSVTWGPFPEARFSTLGKKNWTLLVQEVNRWVPEAAALLDAFTFIPNVRVDDVMVSFAATGGGVGAHVDSYDVFLVQGQGKRRWRLGSKKETNAAFVPDLDLRILKKFAPTFDEVLGPGDMLYVPPGWAHEGTAVSPCLTYSVGFRAPRAAEVWTAFAHDAARAVSDALMLEDGLCKPVSDAGEIPPELRKRVRALVRSLDTSDQAIDRWFARYATMLKPEHPLPRPQKAPSRAQIEKALAKGAIVRRSEEVRFAWQPVEPGARAAIRFYVGGEEMELSAAATPFARLVAQSRTLTNAAVQKALRDRRSTAFVETLFALGALYLEV